MVEQIQPLDYPTKPPPTPRQPWSPISTTTWPVLVAAIWTILLLFVVPHFKSIFVDFKMSLPQLTQVILGLAEYTRRFPIIPLFLWLVAIGLPFLLANVYPYRSATHWVRWICIIFLLFTVVLFGMGLGTPMIPLSHSISGH